MKEPTMHLLKEITARDNPFNGMTTFVNNSLCGYSEVRNKAYGDQIIDWNKESTTPYTDMDIKKYEICKKCVKSANKILEPNLPYKLKGN